jgi:hypothetical protein
VNDRLAQHGGVGEIHGDRGLQDVVGRVIVLDGGDDPGVLGVGVQDDVIGKGGGAAELLDLDPEGRVTERFVGYDEDRQGQ